MTPLGRWPRWRTVRDFAIGGAVTLVVVSSAVNLATFQSNRRAPALSDQTANEQTTTPTQSGAASAQANEPAAQSSDAGPLAVAPSDEIYVVQAGDTLYKIAATYDTTILAIVEENEISDPDRLQVSQILSIPASTP